MQPGGAGMGLIDLLSRRAGRAALLAGAAAFVGTSAVAQSTDFSPTGDYSAPTEVEFRWASAEAEFWRLCDLTGEDIDLPGLREQFSKLEKRAEQIRKDAYAEGTSSVGTRAAYGRIQKRLGIMRARLEACVERLQFWIDSAAADRKAAAAAAAAAKEPAPAAEPDAPSPFGSGNYVSPFEQDLEDGEFADWGPYWGLSWLDLMNVAETLSEEDFEAIRDDIDNLEQLRLSGDCEAFRAELARLQGISLPFDERYELGQIADRPCPPTAQAPATTPASTPSFTQALAPLNTGLAAAITACDPVAFKAAKNRLLEAIGQLISRSPNDPALLAERRRIEETQLPKPCPPESRTSLALPALDAASGTFLALHNTERAAVGVKPLEWDFGLAASAKAYAIKLTSAGQLVHSSREGRKTVRENLLQNLPGGRTPTQMIGVWTDEKRYFKPGIFPDVSTTGDWSDIGHWTQMVWESTTHVGCAVNGDARFEWLVCHYSPPGNRDGTAIGLPSAPQPRHVAGQDLPMILEADTGGKVIGGEWVGPTSTRPQPRGVAGQDGIAPETSTTTTGPPPPPPPPTARDDAPDGDEARHPLKGYFAEAMARHAAAVDCGDRAAAAAELVKMRYALDELKKRLKAAKKAGPYSAVKPDDVQKQIDDLEAKLRSAELRPGPGACPPAPQPRGVVAQ